MSGYWTTPERALARAQGYRREAEHFARAVRGAKAVRDQELADRYAGFAAEYAEEARDLADRWGEPVTGAAERAETWARRAANEAAKPHPVPEEVQS